MYNLWQRLHKVDERQHSYIYKGLLQYYVFVSYKNLVN